MADLLRRSEEAGDIVQGEEVGRAMLNLRAFMFERVYLAADAQREKPRVERMLHALRPLRRCCRRRRSMARQIASAWWTGSRE